jgi:hypothetical protein
MFRDFVADPQLHPKYRIYWIRLFERNSCSLQSSGVSLLWSSLAESFGFCWRGIATIMNFRGRLCVSVLVSGGSGVTLFLFLLGQPNVRCPSVALMVFDVPFAIASGYFERRSGNDLAPVRRQ